MSYPQIVEYNEAIQHPNSAFLDRELKEGKVKETNLGLPLALSGGFALTYTLTNARHKFAVRCFHREVPSAEKRYAAISRRFKSLSSNYFVDFDYQSAGIKVKNGVYPIVKMDWVEGDTLGIFLDKNFRNAQEIKKLREEFRILSTFLEKEGIAHGDLQNGNVIISAGKLRLIDYDGVYVSALPVGNGSEIGHRHFQHALRSAADFGPHMDRFSFIAIDISLLAIVSDPSLYTKYREGGETIFFKANDFADPQNSEPLRLLAAKSEFKAFVQRFTAICEAPPSSTPTLEDFLSGRNIPTTRAPLAPAATKPVQPRIHGYISAFDVVDGNDFSAALKQVGSRVELVGQIHAVKIGTGKRGRGRGLPYVFINFGHWRGNIIKITIWSEGLSQLAEFPSEKWVGKWISVVGLIDQPYHGKHYAFHYQHVGITITDSNQINFIDEKQAAYRLASIGKSNQISGNRMILDSIGSPLGASIGKGTQAPPPSSNAAILRNIKLQSQPATKTVPTSYTSSQVPPGNPSSKQQSLYEKYGYIFWLIGLILFIFLVSR